jgi:hypothetical protein
MRRAYENSGIDLQDVSVQDLYLAVLNQQSDNALETGTLGSIAQILRLAQPFAIIFGVLLAYLETRIHLKMMALFVLAASIEFAYACTFSRGLMLFYVACMALSTWTLPIERKKIALVAVAIVLAGALFYVSSATDRSTAMGIDQSQQIYALEGLFDFESNPISRLIVDTTNPQVLGLILYFTHSLAEGSRLIGAGYSPLLMGGYSFFPYINPIKRILGINNVIDLSSLEHENAWYCMVGDMYIDFGALVVVAFPVLIILMFKSALKYKSCGLWGYAHFIVTGVFLALSPLYSVFNSQGLVYAASLTLAYGNWQRSKKI